MDLPRNLLQGAFIRRLNRFAALMNVMGNEVMVHVANSGRLSELLIPEHTMWVAPVNSSHRKTSFDLQLVQMGMTLCSADARLPNFLMEEAIRGDSIYEFTEYTDIRREVSYEDSRFDLFLKKDGSQCFIETKSVTLVEDRIALFPDAPTSRGTKHVNGLIRAKKEGYRSSVVFIVQREDADKFRVQEGSDPDFYYTLREAIQCGVEVYAYCCRVSLNDIAISKRIPLVGMRG